MNTQQRQLEQRLKDEGWHVLLRESGPDWWADEVWAIESLWRPVGSRLWITFLVDPMSDPYRKGPSVWAVTVTHSLPVKKEDASTWVVPFRHGWEASLEKLVERVGAMRDQPMPSGDSALVRRVQDSHTPRVAFQDIKTKHLYHDATIRAVEYEEGARVSLEVELYGFGDPPGTAVHIIFDGVRNLAEAQRAFSELARESRPMEGIATILGIVRTDNGCFVLDLAEGEIALDARGFFET